MPFALHPRLAADTVEVTRLLLCRVLLMKDRRFPWLLLVPERDGVREIAELPPVDRAELIEEIARASDVLTRLFQPDKLNVGALGNVVPQLHVHVLARFSTDPAWPGPVWGSGTAGWRRHSSTRRRRAPLQSGDGPAFPPLGASHEGKTSHPSGFVTRSPDREPLGKEGMPRSPALEGFGRTSRLFPHGEWLREPAWNNTKNRQSLIPSFRDLVPHLKTPFPVLRGTRPGGNASSRLLCEA